MGAVGRASERVKKWEKKAEAKEQRDLSPTVREIFRARTTLSAVTGPSDFDLEFRGAATYKQKAPETLAVRSGDGERSQSGKVQCTKYESVLKSW
jgi:hypothetical protein